MCPPHNINPDTRRREDRSPALVFPGRVDKHFEIVVRLPAEQVFGLAVVHPVGVELARNVDRIETARAREVVRQLAVIDGPVHADVEELALRARIVDRRDDGRDEIVDMDEIALQRAAVGILEQRHGALLRIALRIGLRHHRLPVRSAEEVVAEGQRVAEIVLFHDPWRAQAAAIEVVLDAELLQHHLFQNLGQRVAAGIGHVRRLFGDRPVVAVEKMADPGIAADQDELARGRAGAEFLEQPEQALDRDVHDVVGGFLAGGEMHDVGDAA